jgi:hypothetical protein
MRVLLVFTRGGLPSASPGAPPAPYHIQPYPRIGKTGRVPYEFQPRMGMAEVAAMGRCGVSAVQTRGTTPGSGRSSCGDFSKQPAVRASATATTDGSPTTCSRSGRHPGHSPPTPKSSRPTTRPSPRYADRSSTENSHTARAQTTASGSPNVSCPPPPLAASNNARCSSSSPTC